MNTISVLSFLVAVLYCNALQAQIALPKVENHLNGEIDYSIEPLDLVQRLANGKDISSGKINTDGSIHFELPEYDIKALYDSINLTPVKFQQWFSINSDCRDRDVFAETPFDEVYAEKTRAIYVKKYGIDVAVLEAASDTVQVRNPNASQDNLAESSAYHWFYIGRAIVFEDECAKISHSDNKTYATVNADISFEKGWNFIEESTKWDVGSDQNDPNGIPMKKTYFTKNTPSSKQVRWTLRPIVDSAQIQIAKKLDGLTPITKEQFEAWAPDKLDGLSIATKEYGKPPEGQENKNNIHLVYADEAQEIELYVVDFSKNPDDVEMIDFAYAMENDGKDEADIKSYITRYNEQENSTQLLYKVDDRMFVEATGTNINGEALWGYIQILNVEKLVNK